MERFLELTFLVVRREEAQVTECWCRDEAVKQGLVALGWPEEGIWAREELGERVGLGWHEEALWTRDGS